MRDAPPNQWHTWREIKAQPMIWRDWVAQFEPDDFRAWLAAHEAEEIWFCGSGTSAYIGDMIVAGLEGRSGLRSVPATDLVARPAAYLTSKAPLVINFGRSGNSAETLGTLNALDALAPRASRLNITCNRNGQLAKRTRPQDRLIVLPEATHDTGFAMTSSFSTMMFTALMILTDADTKPRVLRAADICETVLDSLTVLDNLPGMTGGMMGGLIESPPERAAFMGSGALTFAARESALKVMELSAGRIPCLWDSILGFRHGPKSFVTDQTHLVVLAGYDTRKTHYERDLIAELKQQFPGARLTVIGPGGDVDVPQPDGPLWAAPNAVLFAQVAGLLWADALGLNVDNPFEGQGTLTRVVADVKLYEVGA